MCVRKVKEMRVYSTRSKMRDAFAEEMSSIVGLPIKVYNDPGKACADADIVLTATNAIVPVMKPEWIEPGMHISKETRAWLADQPTGRFEFVFTPKHGSWLNLIEGFFSKLARSVLRHIRVESKQELKDRIMAAMDEFNRHPVVHTWSYKLDQAA